MTHPSLIKARSFIYRNARPIDLARWQYHFENGSAEAVLSALSAYQNPDGGFGHGLEADALNPNSSPIQTWTAMVILEEIGIEDPDHPMIRSILNYLQSKKDFDGHFWFNTIPSNNDHPHAPWWTHSDKAGEYHDYNPTAYFAGFIVRYANPKSELYDLGKHIAQQAILDFNQRVDDTEMHLLVCFAHLALDIRKARFTEFTGLESMEFHLHQRIKTLIDRDRKNWDNGYVCMPSRFIENPKSPYYHANKDAADALCHQIEKTQNADGSWNVTWEWSDYPSQWPISKNWWRSVIVIENMLYLKQFGVLNDR